MHIATGEKNICPEPKPQDLLSQCLVVMLWSRQIIYSRNTSLFQQKLKPMSLAARDSAIRERTKL